MHQRRLDAVRPDRTLREMRRYRPPRRYGRRRDAPCFGRMPVPAGRGVGAPGTSDGILRLRFESHRLAHRCCLRSEIGERKARVADYLARDASAERPRRADEPVAERCRATGLPAAKDRGVRCIPLGPEPPITGSSMPSGDRDRRRRAGRPASSPPENHERVRCARIAAPSAPRCVDHCHRSSSGVRSEE